MKGRSSRCRANESAAAMRSIAGIARRRSRISRRSRLRSMLTRYPRGRRNQRNRHPDATRSAMRVAIGIANIVRDTSSFRGHAVGGLPGIAAREKARTCVRASLTGSPHGRGRRQKVMHPPPCRCVPNDLEPGVQVGMPGGLRASRCEADLHTWLPLHSLGRLKGQGVCLSAPSDTAEDTRGV